MRREVSPSPSRICTGDGVRDAGGEGGGGPGGDIGRSASLAMPGSFESARPTLPSMVSLGGPGSTTTLSPVTFTTCTSGGDKGVEANAA